MIRLEQDVDRPLGLAIAGVQPAVVDVLQAYHAAQNRVGHRIGAPGRVACLRHAAETILSAEPVLVKGNEQLKKRVREVGDLLQVSPRLQRRNDSQRADLGIVAQRLLRKRLKGLADTLQATAAEHFPSASLFGDLDDRGAVLHERSIMDGAVPAALPAKPVACPSEHGVAIDIRRSAGRSAKERAEQRVDSVDIGSIADAIYEELRSDDRFYPRPGLAVLGQPIQKVYREIRVEEGCRRQNLDGFLAYLWQHQFGEELLKLRQIGYGIGYARDRQLA